MFEQVEMALPGGLWSQGMKEPNVISDHEFYWGRKTYAKDVAGGYYSGKLAVLEHLSKIRKQAGVLIVREIRPDYFSEVGVWKVREAIRDAMSKKPLVFDSLDYALKRINTMLRIPSSVWGKNSKVLETMKKQKRVGLALLKFQQQQKTSSPRKSRRKNQSNVRSRKARPLIIQVWEEDQLHDGHSRLP